MLTDTSLSSSRVPPPHHSWAKELWMRNVQAGPGRQWKDLENPGVRCMGRAGEKQSRKVFGVQPQWGMHLLLEAMDSLLHPHLYHSTNPPESPPWKGTQVAWQHRVVRYSHLPWRAPCGPQRWLRPCTHTTASQSTGPQRPSECPPGKEEQGGQMRREEQESYSLRWDASPGLASGISVSPSPGG